MGFIEFDDGIDTINPTNIFLRGGYQVNNNFNIGLESSFTVAPDNISVNPDVDLSVSATTLYLRLGAPISNGLWIYAQASTTNTELTAELNGVEVSSGENDTMIGFGAEIDIGSPSTYLSLNWSKYHDNENILATGFNIGLGTRF